MDLKRILNLFLLITLSLFVLSACSDESESADAGSRGNGNLIDDTTGSNTGSGNGGSSDINNSDDLSDTGSTDGNTTDNTGDDTTGNTGDDTTSGDNTESDDTTGSTSDDTTGDNDNDNGNTGSTTDSEECDENIVSEACYQYRIASAFYDAALNLADAANSFTNNGGSIDANNLQGAKEDYEKAYELVKAYVETYELSVQNSALSSQYASCSSLSNCLAKIEAGFKNIENTTPSTTKEAETYAYSLIDIANSMYLYLFAQVVDANSKHVAYPTHTLQNIYDDTVAPYVVSMKYSQAIAEQLRLGYTDSYSASVKYTVIQGYLEKASNYLSQVDSCSVISDGTVNDMSYATSYAAYTTLKYCNYKYSSYCSGINTADILESAKNAIDTIVASGENDSTYLTLFNNTQKLFVEAQNNLVDLYAIDDSAKVTYSEKTSISDATKAVSNVSEQIFLIIVYNTNDTGLINIANYISLVGYNIYQAVTDSANIYSYVSTAVNNAEYVIDALALYSE